VLGAIMVSGSLERVENSGINSDDFSLDKHRRIFRAIGVPART
jgi:hypothetical protein